MISALLLASTQTWAAYGNFPPPVAPFSNRSLPVSHTRMPIVFPLVGYNSYNDDYNSHRSGFRHTGIDIRAPKMTPIVSPIKGHIGFKIHSFWIYGDYGWKILGTHLNDDTPGTNDGKNNFDFMFAPNIRFGDHVEAGQLIGYVGDSGDATGPHLHFEMYSPNGIRDPFPSLKSAIHADGPVRVFRNIQDKPDPGMERFEICKRNWSHLSGNFFGILVAKQYDNGRVTMSRTPSFVTLNFPEGLADKADIDSWPTDRPASVYFYREAGKMIITKLVPPDN